MSTEESDFEILDTLEKEGVISAGTAKKFRTVAKAANVMERKHRAVATVIVFMFLTCMSAGASKFFYDVSGALSLFFGLLAPALIIMMVAILDFLL